MKNSPRPPVPKPEFAVKPGVSLIIAIVFVSAFMLVIAGLYAARTSVLSSIRLREADAKARYLAESAEEVGAYIAARIKAGSTPTASELAAYNDALFASAREMGVSSCGVASTASPGANVIQTTPCVQIGVIERAAQAVQVVLNNASYFSVPAAILDESGVILGTGDVAGATEVAIGVARNPSGVDGSGGVSCVGVQDANSACHWNKIAVGKTVEIPLAYQNGLPPQFSEFILRVRTPCAGGLTSCSDYERPILFPPVGIDQSTSLYYKDPKKDPVLMQWSVTGMMNNKLETVVARDATVPDKTTGANLRDVIYKNTELSAGRVNLARPPFGTDDMLTDFVILQDRIGGLTADRHKGKLITDKSQDELLDKISQMTSPILRLSLVGQPRKDDDNNAATIPDLNNRALDILFLEYQLLTRCSSTTACAPSDTKQILTGWVEFGGIRREIRKYLERKPSLGGFVLENL